MSAVNTPELRIVGFLCNWCSYGGADTAGVARATQPTDLRIIRVPCSGRVDPLFVLKALFNGADGVLVSGCHPRDCHYSAGNFYARRRLEVLKRFLPILGIDERRFAYTWVSASEGQRWQKVVTTFTEEIHALGPAPKFADASPMLKVAEEVLAPLSQLGTWDESQIEELKGKIKAKLPELDLVLGWKQGRDAAHIVPAVFTAEAELNDLVIGPFSCANLATYLKEYPDKRIGIVVKGCDSRSVVELIQEKLLERSNVTIFALPCGGTFDMRKVDAALGRYNNIEAVERTGESVAITVDGKKMDFPLNQYAQAKCLTCTQRCASVADEFVGTKEEASVQEPKSAELTYLLSLSLEERMQYWRGQMERCLRCYACRNACPLCVCKDYCVAESRNPRWLTQEHNVTEQFFFQTIHALHLAGRCTGCRECERACPVGIPIYTLREMLNTIVAEIFDYRAGQDPDATPPLLGYAVEENKIHEREF